MKKNHKSHRNLPVRKRSESRSEIENKYFSRRGARKNELQLSKSPIPRAKTPRSIKNDFCQDPKKSMVKKSPIAKSFRRIKHTRTRSDIPKIFEAISELNFNQKVDLGEENKSDEEVDLLGLNGVVLTKKAPATTSAVDSKMTFDLLDSENKNPNISKTLFKVEEDKPAFKEIEQKPLFVPKKRDISPNFKVEKGLPFNHRFESLNSTITSQNMTPRKLREEAFETFQNQNRENAFTR